MHGLIFLTVLGLQALLAPVQAWTSAFNMGQTAFPTEAFTEDCVVIDEFAPFAWSPQRVNVREWYATLVGSKSVAARARFLGFREHLEVSQPHDVRVAGDGAYLVFPSVVSFVEHGKHHAQRGDFVVVERRTPHGWRIAAHSWAIVGDHHD